MPFKRQYLVHERDEGLSRKLYAESPGILKWAIAGLHRLRTNGKFTTADAVDVAVERFRVEADPLAAFCKGHVELDATSTMLKDHLYDHYVEWCHLHGFATVTVEFFTKVLYRVWPQVTPFRGTFEGERRQMIKGIRLRKEEPDDNESPKGTESPP